MVIDRSNKSTKFNTKTAIIYETAKNVIFGAIYQDRNYSSAKITWFSPSKE